MKPLCSVSLDLDNLWSYQKVHGDAEWSDYSSYLDVFVPRLLTFLDARRLRISVFVVGKDASLPANRKWLRQIADAGHEICNHSFHHDPWLHCYSREEIARELEDAENAIRAATGKTPAGFRGPGFSYSPDLLEALAARDYAYDASTLPTFIGPFARAYYFRRSSLSREERRQRAKLFGSFRDMFLPIRPYDWSLAAGKLLEIPVTTVPFARTPFHFSYLIFLAERSPMIAKAYLLVAIELCRLTRTEPSILLHPLDFLGPEDADALSFFPGMSTAAERKLGWMNGFFDALEARFAIVPMGEHAAAIHERGMLRSLRPAVRAA